MKEAKFTEKFIGFVDILGFKAMTHAAENGGTPSLAEIMKLTTKMGSKADLAEYRRVGPISCPDAPCIRKDMDIQITQISDCVIVSTEISPAGVINLVWHSWSVCMRLLGDGIMLRGYLERGSVYHDDQTVIGSGYIDALKRESEVSVFKQAADERGTPFIEVDPEVVSYVERCGDACVKEMFWRMAKKDGDLVALFPFQRLVHEWGGPKVDAAREKEQVEALRRQIRSIMTNVQGRIDSSNEAAVSKGRHYLRMLQDQIRVCDETDRAIDLMSGTMFPNVRHR